MWGDPPHVTSPIWGPPPPRKQALRGAGSPEERRGWRLPYECKVKKQYGRGLDIFDPVWRLIKQTTENQITAIVIFTALKMLTSNAAFTASI